MTKYEAIETLGEPGLAHNYRLDDINMLLGCQVISMKRGSDFTGRNSTTIFTDKKNIIKIKSFTGNSERGTMGWVTRRIQFERELGLYHPRKQWFLVKVDDEIYPANIMPYLQPLHILLEDSLIQNDGDFIPKSMDWKINVLCRVIDITLLKAADKICLDSGLSNFGYSISQDKIYYIDDDTYRWDRLISFSQVLATYIRQLDWINDEAIDAINQQINTSILKYFNNDTQWLFVLHERMKSLFVSEHKRKLLDRLLDQIRPQPVANRKSRKPVATDFSTLQQFAILGDVHANAPALKAVLTDMESKGIAHGIVVGDIVGYGPHPAACIALLAGKPLTLVRGNHDHAAACESSQGRFSKSAAWAIDWTIQQLSRKEKDWLARLETHFECDDFIAMHGAPRDPSFFNAYVYESTYEKNLDCLEERNVRMCFHGHTHIPGVYIRPQKGSDYLETSTVVALAQKVKCCLISPGSVGQPRKLSWQAQYAIYNKAEKLLEYHYVDYDIQSVIEDMRIAGFPDFVRSHLEKLVEQA
jgi:predicted phosphodiesterase